MVGLSLRVLQASGVLSLAVLAACGGRTTGLEPNDVDFDPSLPNDGGSSSAGKSGSSTGGKGAGPGTGTGGVSSTAGSAGDSGSASGGKAGSAPSGGASQGGSAGAGDAVAQECQDYCKTTSSGSCGFAGPYSECYSSCAQQLYGEGPACQALAIQLLDCITNSYRTSNRCTDFEECSALSFAYVRCNTPAPEPAPVPTPAPTTCSTTSSSSSQSYCSLDMQCSDGTYYNVNCTQSGPEISTCSCKSTAGSSGGSVFTLNESVGFACFDGLSVCGFPQPGLK